jgi:hypothetical protein
MMRQMGALSVAAMVGVAIQVTAASQAPKGGKDVRDVTIRGCVTAGTSADTFLLMRVTEVKRGNTAGQPVPTDSQGRDVLYSLNSVKGLKALEGRRAEVRGTVDLNNPVPGESTVVSDPSKRLDATTEIKVPSEGQQVKVAADVQPKVAAPRSAGAEKTTVNNTERLVYLMKVRSVRGVDGVC